MKKPAFVNDEIYHVYNRGVEKRKVFLEDEDRLRFLHDLFEFNDTNPANNTSYYFNKPTKSMEVEPRYIKNTKKPRKLQVEILAFCLMPNHYHLLLKQRVEKGVVNFMQKLGTGYTMFFNKKYERVGSLFQNRFKAVLVEKNEHLLYLPHYIHLNPLDMHIPNWRDKKIKNGKKAMVFLEKYRWSSFLDYIGGKNFPSITQRDLLKTIIGNSETYKKDLYEYLQNLELESINGLLLE